ncbi:hypothetical protein [Alkaliphilus transvaalensis]|uniref:hypothetical protein n=1 Tax=Alkaliphilus transvaalensis TaxID=114628 RepID=UPI0004794D0B|nr:hypothetical protein [Alkaliphilus transvaalensis]
MENFKDAKKLQEQFLQLKRHNEEAKDYLAAIELLLVDDNNGKSKDRNLSMEIENISQRISEINNQINNIFHSL